MVLAQAVEVARLDAGPRESCRVGLAAQQAVGGARRRVGEARAEGVQHDYSAVALRIVAAPRRWRERALRALHKALPWEAF